jgi:uncharacterized protein (DUF924 family)
MNLQAQQVLDFWFGPPGDPGYAKPREKWFVKSDAFDAEVALRFGPLIEQALAGRLLSWASDAQAALAATIVLDQLTRNALRGTARAFAGDALALDSARAIVGAGSDHGLTGVQRQFVYLPFEHSEDLAVQRESIALFTQLEHDEPALAGLLDWARKHEAIIERFGRFPHRNAILGRASTPEELEFLRQPGSSF